MTKELAKTVEEAEEMQIASKANILSEQKFKLSYPLFQHMMYKSCESLFEIFKKKNELTNGQLKLLAANLQEKIISKARCCVNWSVSRTVVLPLPNILRPVLVLLCVSISKQCVI